MKSHATAVHGLFRSVEATPDAVALRIIEASGSALELTYGDLYREVARAAGAFDRLGARPGDRVILSLPTGRELISLYLGALVRRIIPLIEPRPHQRGGGSLAGVDAIRGRVDARWSVVPTRTLSPDRSWPDWMVAAEELLREEPSSGFDPPASADICHLQPTSGSTGSQKVAIVTHRNIAANVDGIGRAIRPGTDDALLFWLPLCHDMGLIAVSCALYWQRPMTITDPSHFIRNPIRFWLRLISDYRASITAAPNSAYEACARLARVRTFEQLDLSSLRAAFWGAEPVFSDSIRRFDWAFRPYGYRPEATLPVYGLAEATLAATVSDVDAEPVVQRLGVDGPSEPTTWTTRPMVSVGRPLDGHVVRVVDSERQPLRKDCIGEIELAGPSVVESYWIDAQHRESVPEPDGFLRTGDLGCLHDGELYIVGRTKDLIIIRGRNFIPSEIEAFTEPIVNTGITAGIAAFGIQGADRTESLHLAIESRVLPPPDAMVLEDRVRQAIAEEFGISGITVHWIAKGMIPKTTSGKIQRFRCAAFAGDAQRVATADASAS